jgi:hypothetical protein
MDEGDGFFDKVKIHVRNFFTNWSTYDASLPTKVGLTVKNRGKALFSRSQCCGNHGQPGC